MKKWYTKAYVLISAEGNSRFFLLKYIGCRLDVFLTQSDKCQDQKRLAYQKYSSKTKTTFFPKSIIFTRIFAKLLVCTSIIFSP